MFVVGRAGQGGGPRGEGAVRVERSGVLKMEGLIRSQVFLCHDLNPQRHKLDLDKKTTDPGFI